MDRNYGILLTLWFPLIVVVLANTDLEVKVTTDTGLDPKISPTLNNNSNLIEKTGELKSDIDSGKVDHVYNDKDQVNGLKDGVDDNKLDERNPSIEKHVEFKGDHDDKKDEEASVKKGDNKQGYHVEEKDVDGSMGKDEKKEGYHAEKKDEDGSLRKGDTKERLSEGLESKESTKEVPVSLPTMRKDGSRDEECDASNSCKAEKNALVACLRVPGNDSPDLSLLIQNKGKDPLSITISAPSFVQLEKTKVHLQQKEDKKVKVSITDGGTHSLIVLTAGNENCSLDFRDFTSLNFMKETNYSRKSTHINLVMKPHFLAFVVFSALLLLTASTWTCVSFKRRYFDSNASKYQKLDIELPVSGGGKIESESNNGWDNDWDDKWDDEEAPAMPVTPGLSSKGLASRRLNKEAWKD